jgi:hypothetical protein
MPRRPVEDTPRDEYVVMRLTKGEKLRLDSRRGALSRSEYLRQRALGDEGTEDDR